MNNVWRVMAAGLVWSLAAQAQAAVTVDKLSVGTAIENRELSGEAKEFPSTVATVYAWSKVSADPVPAKIKHVWSVDGSTEAEVSLDVQSPSTRTWSSKHVWPGQWKVDVQDEAGKSLSAVEFSVK